MDQVREEVERVANAAKIASVEVGMTTTAQRNEALRAMAAALRAHVPQIIEANALDMELARSAGTKESLLDRLMLDDKRIESMAHALEDLMGLPDPVGRVLEDRTLDNGLRIQRVSVPMGVVAVVYEARPNVTAEAAGIALKAGNAVVLRGGSMAANSNRVVGAVLASAAELAGMSAGAIGSINSADRAATDVLMKLHGTIDVLVPRGGAGLIAHCVENARVPVIETGTGNCHTYVQATADQDSALNIIHNAKTQRMGVCNACESVLVDEAIAAEFLPKLVTALATWGILIHGDEATCDAATQAGLAEGEQFVAGTDADWGTEYLGPEISVKLVDGVHEAVAHINRYSTHHSESIITEDDEAAELFLRAVDSAAVYVNASTRFTDGGEFGLGAEIGISTQKLHARGPFALEALTTYKYQVRGTGQVRG
jgi:glutamate-5-semialdehyde dehydrogenase